MTQKNVECFNQFHFEVLYVQWFYFYLSVSEFRTFSKKFLDFHTRVLTSQQISNLTIKAKGKINFVTKQKKKKYISMLPSRLQSQTNPVETWWISLSTARNNID